MSRQIKGLLYFYFTDMRRSLLIFWSILLSIVLFILLIAFLLRDVNDGFMTISLTVPIYIYCSILGFTTVKESIPFSIKMGATRKNIFVSLGILFAGLSVLNAVVASTLQSIIESIVTSIGVENFYFIHVLYFLNNTWLNRVIVDTSILFFSLAIFFILGLLFYKYGTLGGGVTLGLFALSILLGHYQGWLTSFFIDVFQSFSMVLFYQILLIGIIVYCISIVLLRKITTVKIK